MTKNTPEQEMITIPKIEYMFLKSQNEQLIKQNRELQTQLNGRNREFVGIINSLGKTDLDKYAGINNVR